MQLENVSYGIEPLESSTVYEHMLYQINNDKIDFSLLKENFPMPQLVQKSYKILVKSNVSNPSYEIFIGVASYKFTHWNVLYLGKNLTDIDYTKHFCCKIFILNTFYV